MRISAMIAGCAFAVALAGCTFEQEDETTEADEEELDQIESAVTAGFDLAAEQADLSRHNNHRHNHVGAAALDMRACLKSIARDWAKHMANGGTLAHNPNVGAQINNRCSFGWHAWGENIGVGPSEHAIFNAWLDSAPHHHNIDTAGFRRVGVGAYKKGNSVWMVVDFVDPP